MLLQISTESSTPLAEQISRQIRATIARGEISPGHRLPSARELAESLGVNMHTVLRAYQDLRDAGLVELRRGRGAVVRGNGDPLLEKLHAAAREFASTAQQLGLTQAEAFAELKEAMS